MSDLPTPETDAVERGFTHKLRQDPQFRLTIHARHLERQLDESRAIIAATLKALPVGYIQNHTPESIPERVADIVARCAEADRQRDAYAETLREIFRLCGDYDSLKTSRIGPIIKGFHPELAENAKARQRCEALLAVMHPVINGGE